MMTPPAGKVMKVFIEEDERYELLPVESRIGSNDFQFTQEIDLRIDNTQEEEQMLMNVAQNFLDQVGEKAIARAEQEICQEAASEYLASLTEKIAETLAI